MSREKGWFDAESTLVRDHSVLSTAVGPRKLPRLELVRGPGAPREYPITADEVVLGRSLQANVCIDSGLLSRRHAAVRRHGPELKLVDLDSANGVYVNGVRVHSAVLCDGDTIQVGDAVLVFREGS